MVMDQAAKTKFISCYPFIKYVAYVELHEAEKLQIFQNRFYCRVAKTVNNFHMILYFLTFVLLLPNLDLPIQK